MVPFFCLLSTSMSSANLISSVHICWVLWTRRNKGVLDHEFIPTHRQLAQVRSLLEDYRDASSCAPLSINSRQESLVSWQFPWVDWGKLNADGSARGNSEPAGVGGMIRDHNGSRIKGLCSPIGVASNRLQNCGLFEWASSLL